jgi:hypothetical protein
MHTLMYVQTMLFHLYCFIFIYVPLLSFGQTCINMTKGRPYIAWWADILAEAIIEWYTNISYFLLQDWPLSKFYFPFHSYIVLLLFVIRNVLSSDVSILKIVFLFSIRTLSSVIIKLTTENTSRERIERKIDSILDDDNNSNYRWV